MASNAGNQRIIPLEEGWNQEIKAKVSVCVLVYCLHMQVRIRMLLAIIFQACTDILLTNDKGEILLGKRVVQPQPGWWI